MTVLPLLALLDSRLLIRWRVKVGMWMGWSGYEAELDTRLLEVTVLSSGALELLWAGLQTGHLRCPCLGCLGGKL